MEYTCYNMNAYNLHIINTDKFKTITVDVSFRRKIKKEEITIRNLLKDLMVNSSFNYPTERSLIIQTERLYDLKLLSSSYRIGSYSILSFKTRFLNEKYTEDGMNEESIKFLLDLIFKPKLDNDVDKCKKKIEKSILSLSDNKIKYSLMKLLETTENMPYSYNNYGYKENLDKITDEDIKKYYDSVISDDIVDVFVVGEVDPVLIKEIFKEYFKASTFHKNELSLLVDELPRVRKVKEFREFDNVNQTQLTMLCSLNGITDYERKYVLPVYGEMLGGSSNSILFDTVREKNSYAYYVNALVKPYDNVMMIYSGIQKGNDKEVFKLIEKSLVGISKGKFDVDKLENSKNTLIAAIESSLDNPISIINNYYAKVLVNSLDVHEKIEKIKNVSKDDIISVSKKISVHTMFLLEASDEENND
ncbi:MAG: insulinase family protein [Bacilli bacterium]|nr:insulinase family protein [Bacilli bacterium]